MSEITQLEKDICLIILNLNGVSHIEFSYSGSGDDGAIDDICFFNINNETINPNKDSYINIDDIKYNILENTADELLCQITDWWNNDGGYGNLTLNTLDGTYSIQNNVGSMTYTAESYEGDFTVNKPPTNI